jgi:hypothetical protein
MLVPFEFHLILICIIYKVDVFVFFDIIFSFNIEDKMDILTGILASFVMSACLFSASNAIKSLIVNHIKWLKFIGKMKAIDHNILDANKIVEDERNYSEYTSNISDNVKNGIRILMIDDQNIQTEVMSQKPKAKKPRKKKVVERMLDL